jgi:hypothetical protein
LTSWPNYGPRSSSASAPARNNDRRTAPRPRGRRPRHGPHRLRLGANHLHRTAPPQMGRLVPTRPHQQRTHVPHLRHTAAPRKRTVATDHRTRDIRFRPSTGRYLTTCADCRSQVPVVNKWTNRRSPEAAEWRAVVHPPAAEGGGTGPRCIGSRAVIPPRFVFPRGGHGLTTGDMLVYAGTTLPALPPPTSAGSEHFG